MRRVDVILIKQQNLQAVVDFPGLFESMDVNILQQRSFTSPIHPLFSVFTNEFAVN